ncbi:MAG: GNAT family N-acetyltransferase [Jaaginema sp. PMC 1080.18]|nr:GNAT family N-acetyltransferase [Jaaginema sp. PMC 1080.18]MEC4868793.1 GNAT family N-acetyltransferase [Jaaginema sp. PMC 1078.18]
MFISYKKLQSTDLDLLKKLVKLYINVFEEKNIDLPRNDYFQKLLENPNLIFLICLLENKVIGGATVHLLPSVYGDYSEAYIYDLAVATDYQRQGIGSGLLEELTRQLQSTKVREIFVQADFEDKHAMSFYQATGGQEENVRHYTYALSSNTFVS